MANPSGRALLVNTSDTITVNIMGISIERDGSSWNGTVSGGSVVYDLAYAALHATEPAERLRAVDSLGRTDDPRAVRPLMDLLEDSDPVIRLAATKELGHLKSGRPVDDLILRLRDRRELDAIRIQAIVTLAAIRSTGAIRGLREFAGDEGEDATLRLSARNLLGEIGLY